MKKKSNWIWLGASFLLIIAAICSGIEFHIFTLSIGQVKSLLPKEAVRYDKLGDCPLLPGDILIRRHITQRVRLYATMFNPYFTHTAFYYSDGRLIEAVGNEKNSVDDIQIDDFLKSDWATEPLEGWVVIRPKISENDIETIRTCLKAIAADPSYTFGIGKNKTSCAELIFDQFVKDGLIIRDKKIPRAITPDFLYQYALGHPVLFEVVGYNFNQ
jgi:hypothetical protein